MKQVGYVTLVLALVLSMATLGFGQGKVTMTKDGGTAIQISGEIDFHYVYKDDHMEEVRDWDQGGFTGGNGHSGTNQVFYWPNKFRFDIAVADGVDAVVTMENNPFNGYGVGGTGADFFEFGLTYIIFREVYNKDTTVSVGVQDIKFGDGFFMDLRHAESAWDFNPVDPRYSGWILWNPASIVIDYNAAPVNFKLFGALANLDSGITTSTEEWVYGMTFDYDLEGKVAGLAKGGSLNLLATMFVGGDVWPVENTHSQELWTFGIGLNLKDLANVKGLSIYGEGYWQFGDAGEADVDGDGEEDTLDAGGWAARGGLKYEFDNPNKPWISLEYWMLSGDDDEDDADLDGFVSYENVNDFLIGEHSLYGLDVDTNYTALKVKGGVSTQVGGKNLDLSAKLGFFSFTEDAPLDSTPGALREDELGSELDFTMKLDYTKNVSFDLTIAWLWSADALELYTDSEEDSLSAFMLGTNVKF